MKKIIHLSDLHIGFPGMVERFQYIANMIRELKQPSENYVIVITGDLVDDDSDSYYEQCRYYVQYLRDNGYTVLPVPGNHDHANLLFHRKRNVEKFKQTYFGTTDVTYPKLDIIEYGTGEDDEGYDQKIAFMGLDSMAEELHWYDNLWANGELGERQLKRLKTMLNKEKVENCRYKVVYLHHHPFDPISDLHKLKDAGKFCDILREYIDDDNPKHEIQALLFGHNHDKNHPGLNWNGYIQGIPHCYDGGTSTRKLDTRCIHRVIDLRTGARPTYNCDFLRGYRID